MSLREMLEKRKTILLKEPLMRKLSEQGMLRSQPQGKRWTNRALFDVRKGQAGPIEIRNHTDQPVQVAAFQSDTGQFFIEIYMLSPSEIERLRRQAEIQGVPAEEYIPEIVKPHDYLQPDIRPSSLKGR